MTLKVRISIEAAPYSTAVDGASQKYMGAVLHVALDAGGDWTGVDKNYLKKALSPWRWSKLEWSGGGTQIAAPSGDGSLEAVLDRYVAELVDGQAMNLLGPPDPEADEYRPNWPGLLAQIGRMAPQISHRLRLAHLFSFGNSEPTIGTLAVEVTPDGTPAGTGVEIIVEPDPQIPSYADLANGGAPIGLIMGLSRLVKTAGETKRDWLSELSGRIGGAADPVARLADLLDAAPPGISFDAQASLEAGLAALVEALAQTETLLPLCHTSNAALRPAEAGFAGRWREKLRQDAAPLTAALKMFAEGKPSPDKLPSWASHIRSVHSGSALVGAFGQAVLASLPTAAANEVQVRDTAVNRLSDPENVRTLLHGVLPEAVYLKSEFHAAIVKAAARGEDDVGRVTEAFLNGLRAHLKRLLAITGNAHDAALDAIAARLAPTLFKVPTSVDVLAEAGLPFRVDTVFGEMPATRAGGVDLHTQLDGYLVAVRESKDRGVTYGGFALATQATVLLKDATTTEPLGILATPLPVSFDLPLEDAPAAEGEVRQAIASYRGGAMIPHSGLADPTGQEAGAEPVRFTLDYRPAGALPALAYGRVYQTVAGYQGLAGALPAAFCSATDPVKFDAARLAAIAATLGDYIKTHRPLRSKLPGAPLLLNADDADKNAPLRLGDPADDQVRPLWRELAAKYQKQDDRKLLGTAKTVFLDPIDPPGPRKSARFTIAPPALALEGRTKEGQAFDPLIWRYWAERGRDAPRIPLPDPPPGTKYVDDPAVIDNPLGQEGKGGVLLTLRELSRDGMSEPIASELVSLAMAPDATLPAGKRIAVTVNSGAATAKLRVVGLEAIVDLAGPTGDPLAGGLYALEIRTVVDKRFLDPAQDGRLVETLGEAVLGHDEVRGFGSTVLVFECLPPEDHLPRPEALWKALSLKDAAGGVLAVMDTDGRAFDYVGSIRSTRQEWRWDGGPIVGDPLAGLWATGETSFPRDERFTDFEKDYFAGRSDSGRVQFAQHSAGTQTELFTIEPEPNRAANYLRVRTMVTSRYAPLRSKRDPDGQNLRRSSQSELGQTLWRALPLRCRRRDRLSTPRLAVAAPLFGKIGTSGSGGGIALYLDHPMYDTVNGGGLAERIEAEIMVEHVQKDVRNAASADGQTAALMIGQDPIASKKGDPFGNASERVAFKSSGGQWTGVDTALWNPEATESDPEGKGAIIACSAVLGQTLEPESAAPVIPFSIALLEPSVRASTELAISPGSIARIRIRTALEPAAVDGTASLSSPWSAPLWVHFLGDSGQAKQWPIRRVDDEEVEIAGSGEIFDRLVERAALNSPSTPRGRPFLVGGLAAVYGPLVTDISGETLLRTSGIATPVAQGSVLRIKVPKRPGQATFVRLLEIESVRLAGVASTSAPEWQRWIDPAAQGEQPERIVSVGPMLIVRD